MGLKEISRSVQYSNIATMGFASKILPQNFGKKILKRNIARKMVQLRGIPMKIAQILSMSSQHEDDNYQEEALSEITQIDADTMLGQIFSENPSLGLRINSFDEFGIPASVGQVHRATVDENPDFALKIKYPTIDGALSLDESLFDIVTKSFGSFKRGFDLSEYREMIKTELHKELDYKKEAKNQMSFYLAFKNNENIAIPYPHLNDSGEGYLLMNWEESMPLDKFLSIASPEQKKDASDLLVDFFMTSLFSLKIIHTDPNPGNFGFRIRKGKVQLVVYDFGSVRTLHTDFCSGILKLLKSLDSDTSNIPEIFVTLGFSEEMLRPLFPKLTAFADLLCEPFLSRNRYDLKKWNRKQRAKDILGSQRWNFMISAPAHMFPFMRSVQGLFFYLGKLDATIYLRPFIERFWQVNSNGMNQLPLKELRKENSSQLLAQSMKLRIMESGKEKVALELPRKSIENLDSLITDDIKEKLIQKKIELEQIVKKVRQEGYRPMPLFELEEANKSIKVWLE